jgi:hypothetical protein
MAQKPWQKSGASKVLRKLPRENAFFFFTSVGNYTGENASSFEEFLEKIMKIDINSLEFHLHRGDFEKWISQILEDKELAEQIGTLRSLLPTGDALRSQLVLTLTKHHEKLLKEEVK